MSLPERPSTAPIPLHPEIEFMPDRPATIAPFVGAVPQVRLQREESTLHPFSVAVAAAWSCYGGKPARVENVRKLIGPAPEGLSDEKAADRDQRQKRAMRLYSDLFAAGHHTTLQHASFTFVLDNVSRLAIWSFFHSHPFYNSEQVSQRYREVTGETVLVPDLPAREQEIYTNAIERSLQGYRRLVDLLTPDFARDYAQVFPARSKGTTPAAVARFDSAVQKRAQEVARYVLPLATPSHLYHTVNGLTLLRYHVLANQPDAPAEVRYIVDRMIEEVLAVDPYFLGAPDSPLDLRQLATGDSIESKAFESWHESLHEVPNEAFFLEYDAALGNRQQSRLAGFDPQAETTMANAVRTVLARTSAEMSDASALAQVLDPKLNPCLGHPLFLGMSSKLMQTMNHIPFTFQKRISGAEDAQNQRHRGTLSSSPLLLAHQRREPDVMIPWAIQRNPETLREYHETVSVLWTAKNTLLDAGVDPQWSLYLLPNSHRVRFYETGTLLNYYWKWVKRLCYDAQREIFSTALEEVAQVREQFPIVGQYVDGPPCVMRSRAGSMPTCPEGERFCGIPVWRGHQFETLEERRVM